MMSIREAFGMHEVALTFALLSPDDDLLAAAPAAFLQRDTDLTRLLASFGGEPRSPAEFEVVDAQCIWHKDTVALFPSGRGESRNPSRMCSPPLELTVRDLLLISRLCDRSSDAGPGALLPPSDHARAPIRVQVPLFEVGDLPPPHPHGRDLSQLVRVRRMAVSFVLAFSILFRRPLRLARALIPLCPYQSPWCGSLSHGAAMLLDRRPAGRAVSSGPTDARAA